VSFELYTEQMNFQKLIAHEIGRKLFYIL